MSITREVYEYDVKFQKYMQVRVSQVHQEKILTWVIYQKSLLVYFNLMKNYFLPNLIEDYIILSDADIVKQNMWNLKYYYLQHRLQKMNKPVENKCDNIF